MNATTPLDRVLSEIQQGLGESYARRAAALGGTDEQVNAARQYAERPDALHGDTFSGSGNKQCGPIHILMCYLTAAGKTVSEIAAQTGYSIQTVGAISRQPWFRERFLQIAKEDHQEAVTAFVKGQSLASLETLVEVRDNKDNKGSERVAAANAILDRALGKPAVYVKTEGTMSVASATSTKADLERQIEAVQLQLQSRGIRTANAN